MYVGDNQSPGNLASLWDICVLCMQETINLPGIQRHFGIFVYYVCRRHSISRESSVTLIFVICLCIMYALCSRRQPQSPGYLASLWDICALCMQETINLPGIQRHFEIFVYYVCRRQSISRVPSVTLGYLCITYVGDNQSPGNLASLWDICVLCMQETINLPGTQRHFGIFVYYVCRRQSISRESSVTLGYLCIMYEGDNQSPGYLASLWDICVLCMQETHNLPGTQRHFGIFVYYVCRRQSISRVPSVTLGYLCITYVGDNQSHGYLASLWDICVLRMQETINLPGTQRHFGIFVYYVCRRQSISRESSVTLGYLCIMYVGDNQSPGNLASLWDICVLCMQETINLPGTQRHFGIFVYYVCRRQSISRESSVTLGYLCIMYVGDPQSPGYLASLWDICVLCMQETINLTGTQRHFGIFVYYVCRRQSISRESSVTLGYLCIMYVGDNQSPGNLASLWDICVLCMQETINLPGIQRHFGIFVYYVCRRPTISRVPSVTLGYLCIMYVGDNQSPGNLASLWDICVLCMQETINLPGIQRHFGIFVYYVCRRQSISRESSVTLGYLCIMYVGDNNLPGTQRHFGIFVYYVMQETINLPGIQRHFGIFVYYVCRRQSISRESSVTLGYLCIMYVGDNQSPGNLASLWDICVLCMQETINLPGIQRHFGIFVYYVCRRQSISRVPSVTLGYLCIMYVGDNQSPGYLASLWDICVLCNVGVQLISRVPSVTQLGYLCIM